MNIEDYRFLLSEQGHLKKLIEQTSAGNVIGRMSLEARLRQVEEDLDAYKGDSLEAGQVQNRETHHRKTSVQVDEVEVTGQFQGVLPKNRRVEFLLLDTDAEFLKEAIGTTVEGSVEGNTGDVVAVKDILGRKARITARTRRVGQEPPRYVITGWKIL